jgi:hypothetical protein
MLKYILLFPYLGVSSLINGQNPIDSILVIHQTLKNVVFVTNDSVYKFTRVIQDDGVFQFSEYQIDSIYLNNNQIETRYSYSKGGTITRRYKVSYDYLPGSDTIYSYFPSRKELYNKTHISSIYYELKYSYILMQLGEPRYKKSLHDFVRIIWPCEEDNICNSYKIFRLNFYNGQIRLNYTVGESFNLNGMSFVKKDSSVLRKRDYDKVVKVLDKVNNMAEDDCIKDGNPWMLETIEKQQHKRSILSNYCIMKRKQPSQIAKLCTQFNIIVSKYFPINCDVNQRIFEMY